MLEGHVSWSPAIPCDHGKGAGSWRCEGGPEIRERLPNCCKPEKGLVGCHLYCEGAPKMRGQSNWESKEKKKFWKIQGS